MNIKVCDTVCKNCPFKLENSDKLFVDTVRENFKDSRKITPCHMDMVKYTGSENTGVEIYAQEAPEFKVCRGMVLSRIKSEVNAEGIYEKLYADVLFNSHFNERGDIYELR